MGGNLAAAASVLLFLLLKLQDLHYESGDENIYFYYAKLVSEGLIPYRDFFFAHEPLQIYLFAVIYKIFGFHYLLLKSIALLSTTAAAAGLFLYARDRFDSERGALGVAFFLFSYVVLWGSTNNLGVNICVAFFVWGFYFFHKKKDLCAGAAFGLALLTTLHALPLCGVLAAYLLLQDARRLLPLAGGLVITFGLPHLFFLALAGRPFLSQVYFYHFHIMKVGSTLSQKIAYLFFVVKNDLLLFFFAALALVLKDRKSLILPGALCGVYFLFLLRLKGVYPHYMVPLYPFLSMMAACALYDLTAPLQRPIRPAVWVLTLLFFTASHYEETRKDRRLYRLHTVADLVGHIRNLTRPDDLIFGDDYATPLLSLLSGRRLALDMADTNPTRFQSQYTDIGDVMRTLRARPPKLMIFHHIRDFSSLWDFPKVKDYVATMCPPTQRAGFVKFQDGEQAFYIYSCAPVPPGS